MIDKFTITIDQLSGDQPRRVYIYLPASYNYKPRKRYPVLYMFDGHNVFFDEDATYGKSWGMESFLDFTQSDIIVAAVECCHYPAEGRLSEYSPFTFDDSEFGHVEGRGQQYMDWLINEFKSFVDENYRTLPQRKYTYIAGSSMGGLMSLYALLQYNHVFSKAAALSPCFWVDMDGLKQMIQESRLRKNTILYMDYGEYEFTNDKQLLRDYGFFTSYLIGKGIKVTSRIIPKGDHSEASWERQVGIFMDILTYRED